MNFRILISLLLIIFVIILINNDYKRSNRIDSPGVVIGTLWLMMNVSSMIYLSCHDSYFDNIAMVFSSPDWGNMYLKYIVVQSVFFLFLYLGMWRKSYCESSSFYEFSQNFERLDIKRILVVCLFFFSIAVFIMWKTNGGLMGIISNFGDRSGMNNNNILLQIGMSTPYILTTCACVYYNDFSENKRSLFRLITIIVGVVFGLMLTGGRKPFMMVLYYLFFFSLLGMTTFEKGKYRKLLPIIPVVIILFLTPRVLRDRNNLDSFLSSGQLTTSMYTDKSSESVSDLSYIYTYVGIVNYFNSENFYYGSSFIDLLYAYVPRRYMLDKPPVDEGMYVATLFRTGKLVDHPARLDDLYIASWPPETLGNAYMNFGILGVVLFAFILGNVYRWFYMKLQTSTKHKLYFLIMYPFVIFAFQISNLRIVSFLTMTVTFFCILFLSKNLRFFIRG